MKQFSPSWIGSTDISKQRKYRLFSPMHTKAENLNAHLSKELRQKFGKRSLRIRKGDTVRVSRGQYKKKTGKVEDVDIRKGSVYVAGIENVKKDGSKSYYALKPSNLIIIDMKAEDPKRKKQIERTSPSKAQQKPAQSHKPAKEQKVKQ